MSAETISGTIRRHGHDWEYKAEPCKDDPDSLAVGLTHPGSGKHEWIGYANSEAGVKGVVEEFADKECGD